MKISRHTWGERGSLPLALLAAIIVAGLAVVLVARIVATQNQVRFDEGFHASLPVADAGTNIGKFWLNEGNQLQAIGDAAECDDAFYSPGDFPVGCSTPEETRLIDGSEYTFSLTRISSEDWEITSTGTDAQSGESRRAVATIRERPLVEVALFADTFIGLGGNNAADSYSSDPSVPNGESWCRGNGFAATNGVFVASGTSGSYCSSHQRTVDRVMLHDWSENPGLNASDELPGGDRCDHAGGGGDANCKTVSEASPEYLAPELFDDPLELGTDEKVAFIEHALQACDDANETHAGTYNVSSDGGVLQPGTFDPDKSALPEPFEFPGEVDGPFHCVDYLRFDVNTKIDATSEDPVIIVSRYGLETKGQGKSGAPHVGCEDEAGNVTNCFAGNPEGKNKAADNDDPQDWASRPNAQRLWIFTNGDVTLRGHSAVSGVIWAPRAKCIMREQGDIFGSLICDHFDGQEGKDEDDDDPSNALGGWKFHYDEALADVSSGEFYTSSWREEFID